MVLLVDSLAGLCLFMCMCECVWAYVCVLGTMSVCLVCFMCPLKGLCWFEPVISGGLTW